MKPQPGFLKGEGRGPAAGGVGGLISVIAQRRSHYCAIDSDPLSICCTAADLFKEGPDKGEEAEKTEDRSVAKLVVLVQ